MGDYEEKSAPAPSPARPPWALKSNPWSTTTRRPAGQPAVAGLRVTSDEIVHRVTEGMRHVPFDLGKRGQGPHPGLG